MSILRKAWSIAIVEVEVTVQTFKGKMIRIGACWELASDPHLMSVSFADDEKSLTIQKMRTLARINQTHYVAETCRLKQMGSIIRVSTSGRTAFASSVNVDQANGGLFRDLSAIALY